MDALTLGFSAQIIAMACGAALFAGFVKGVVGFAMPMLLMSTLASFLPPDIALAGLILPTLVSNGLQALRQGWSAAVESFKAYRIYLLVGGVVLVSSAQLVPFLSSEALLLILGVPVAGFSLLQLLAARFRLARRDPWIEAAVAVVAGFLGGLSGVWGPATVMYLTALDTEKTEQVRVQGVIYGLGAVVLAAAHSVSGVLRWETVPLSLALVPPAILGMWLGGQVLERIDQAQFRRATLLVLLLVGLNLVRRALWA